MMGKLDAIHRLKQSISDMETRLSEMKAALRAKEVELLSDLSALGIDSAKTARGTVYKHVKTVPRVVEWRKFYEYVEANSAFHLLERRPSVKACVEECTAVGMIPGVELVSFDQLRYKS